MRKLSIQDGKTVAFPGTKDTVYDEALNVNMKNKEDFGKK